MSLKSIASTQGLIWCMAATVGMLGLATSAHANLINFDNLANGTVVTNQYAAQDITFSSVGGEQLLVTAQSSYQSTPPNFICTGTGGIDCTGTVIFSFTTPVDNLKFDAVGNQNTIGTSFAQADIYQNGILTQSNLNLLVSQGNFLPDAQDLSAYANITEVLIHSNTDPAGTGYDTISFTTSVTSSVPEPATWAMMLLGFAGMGFVGFRRAKTRSVSFVAA
jgi:PEP-CTERM motif